MSDETTPQESAAMPPASAGSHGKVTVSLHTDDSACAFPNSRPIRRQRFTLTDEEREAIAWIALTHSRLKTAGDRPGRTKEMDLDAVWGFLDRTK
jgi:hypothetical protein